MNLYYQLQKQALIEERVIQEADWYLENKTSIRDVAKNFLISRSTVYRDITERLSNIDYDRYLRVSYLIIIRFIQ